MAEPAHDPETGEIIEGEVLNRTPQRAADGGRVPYAATTAGEFINFIEDGQFSADLNAALAGLATQMLEMAEATGNKQAGSATIKLEFSTEGGPFIVAGSYKITPPKEKRKRTLVWQDDEGRFTRSQPRQGQFFGVREVGGSSGPARSV